MSVTAADVGDLGAIGELADDAGQRRQPLLDEVRAVTVAVKSRDAAEELLAVLTPADAFAGLEGFERLGLVRPHR